MQKVQFNLLDKLQKDLKSYRGIVQNSLAESSKYLEQTDKDTKEIFVNLQDKVKKAIASQDANKVMEARQELMNYLTQRNGGTDSSNK